MSTIAVIGAGHLGTSIIQRLLLQGHTKIIATKRSQESLQSLRMLSSQIVLTTNNREAVEKADVVIIATKQASFEEISFQIKDAVENKLVISLCPLSPLEKLESLFGKRVVRLITPVDAICDVVCYVGNQEFTLEDERDLGYIFGKNLLRITESQMPLSTTYTLLRGVLNSYLEPLLDLGNELPDDTKRKILGNMLISAGQEIVSGMSAQERLRKASGGMNPNSFTLKFFEKLKPSQEILANEMQKVYEVFGGKK